MSSEDSDVEMADRALDDSMDNDDGSVISSGEEEEIEADLQALLEGRARAQAQRQDAKSRKVFVNDVDALEAKRAEITLRIKGVPEPIPFLETLTVTSAQPLRLEDAQDDLEREKAFYVMALAAMAEAQQRLGGSIPFRRPADYFASMLKSDEHMTSVRALLLKEKKRGDDAATKRKSKEGAKFQKQVQSERAQQRAKSKQSELDAIKKWRQVNKKSGDDQDFPVELLDPNSELRRQLSATGELVSKDKGKGKDKEAADDGERKGPSKASLKAKKYGFGGKKGRNHKNPNAASFSEADKEWNARANKTIGSEFRKYGQSGKGKGAGSRPQQGSKGKSAGSGASRLGKRQRQQQGGRPAKKARRE